MKIGNRIKKYRKARKLTQEELGGKIGKSVRMIQKYESGEVEPSIAITYDIAEALGINRLDLLRDEEENKKIYRKKHDYPERTKFQGIESELEIYFLQMIDEHNINNKEAVKVATRFAYNMVGLIK